MLKRLSIANKLFYAFLALTVIAIATTSAISFQQSRESLREAAFEQLTSVREMKAFQIEDYLDFISKQVVTFSADRMVIDAVRQFEAAFHDLESELKPDQETIRNIDSRQKAFYEDEFLPRLSPNLQLPPESSDYLPKSLNTRLLQHLYVSNNPYNAGSKDVMDDAGDDSTYTRVHREMHPIFREYLQNFGYYDIFLLDENHGDILYTVFKEVDFGTSLEDGPYANTALARVYEAARKADSPGFVTIADFEPYHPSYNRPAAFIASPIFDHGRKIGVLAFQMPIDRINEIMTNDQSWADVGLGESGETYIVAGDFRLRNQSRFLIEDSENYFQMIEDTGTPSSVIDQIRNLNSTIGLQEVRTEGTEAALAGQSDTRVFDDYRGVSVLSSFKPLDIAGLHWAIMSEIDEAEAFAAIGVLARKLILTVALLLALAFAAAVFFSRTITRPLARLSENSNALARGDLEISIDTSGRDEIGDLARDFDNMRQSLRKVVGELEDLNLGLEQKVAERTSELESSERRIKAIIDTATEAILVTDQDMKILLWNPAAEQMFGMSNDEALGRSVREIVPEAYKAGHDEGFKSAVRHGGLKNADVTHELSAMGAGGQEIPVELSIGTWEIAGKPYFSALIRDITGRKTLEAEIERQLAFVESLVDTIPNPLTVKGPDSSFILFNRAYERVFGMSRGDYLGKNVLEMGYIPEDVRQDLQGEDVSLLQSGGELSREVMIEASNGKLTDMFYQAKTFDFPDGSRAGLMGLLTDVTTIKELERQLEQANKRMLEELNFARDIQMGMLPLLFPVFPDRAELTLDAVLEPAREVGGDFYDFYFLDENRLCLVVADVSGKGAPAALFMAVSKTLIKSRAAHDFDASSILTKVNGELSENNTTSTFVTVFLAILDVSDGKLQYCNAGHNPPYIKRASGELEKLEDLHGPILGVLPGLAYTKSDTVMARGDMLVMYTDGVTEAMNEQEEEYTDQRLADLLEGSSAQIPNELTVEITDDVRRHQGKAEQSDDITLLATTYQGARDDDERHLEVHIRNRTPELSIVEERFHEFAARNKIADADRQIVSTVIDDLLSNVISYAYPEGGDHEIVVELNLRGSRLVLLIEDDGTPFNPFAMEEPDIDKPLGEREIGGLGIHLVRQVMDDHLYRRRDNKNIVILTKELGGMKHQEVAGENANDSGPE